MSPADLVLSWRGLRFGGVTYPCAMGYGGLTGDKREGDGATPRGVHRITGCLYRPDRLPPPGPWAVPIRPRDIWSDDPDDPDYNHLTCAPTPFGHEVLRRADPLYDLILLTDWNWPHSTRGQGSAIFLHQWRKPRHPTAGCIALRRDHLMQIARRISPGARLIVP